MRTKSPRKNPKRTNMTNVSKTVDVAALELLCDKLECGDANHRATAAQIRKAINGAKLAGETNLCPKCGRDLMGGE